MKALASTTNKPRGGKTLHTKYRVFQVQHAGWVFRGTSIERRSKQKYVVDAMISHVLGIVLLSSVAIHDLKPAGNLLESIVYKKRSAFKGLLCGVVAVAVWLCVGTAMAGIFDNAMSMDESPVEFSLGAAKYRIPKNYLSQMSDWSGGPQEYAAIRVTYPGLKPFSKETESCMHHKTPCRIYEVNLREKFPASEDGAFNREEVEHPELGKPGPYGFTLFTKGPENARMEFYRKIVDGKPIMFFCLPYDVDGKRGAICSHAAHTSSGVTLSYFFDFNGLRDAVEVDTSLKQLIDGFSINENK